MILLVVQNKSAESDSGSSEDSEPLNLWTVSGKSGWVLYLYAETQYELFKWWDSLDSSVELIINNIQALKYMISSCCQLI